MDPRLRALEQIVGREQLLTSDEDLDFFSMDIMWQGERPVAVAVPTETFQVAEIEKFCEAQGFSVVPRGGGMSYTKGYVPQSNRSITIDMRQLDRIVEINEADMYVTVECGCTWKKLNEALVEKNIRTPYWGTGSGRFATVGGSLSQGSIFFGSGVYGDVHDSVLSLEVVLGGGRVLKTGSAASKAGFPFQRYFGPDLAGLFLGDAGALGIKTKATFRLIRCPQIWDGISFGFESFDDMIKAQTEIARAGFTSECVGLGEDAGGENTSLKFFSEGVKMLGAVAREAGVKKALDVALAGTGVLKGHAYTLHTTVDGDTNEECKLMLADVTKVCEQTGSRIDSSVPTVLRSDPFPDVGGYLVRHDGRRWIPIHAVVPPSKIMQVHTRTQEYIQQYEGTLRQHNISMTFSTFAIRSSILYEPQWFWPDSSTVFYDRTLQGAHLKALSKSPRNLESYSIVTKMMEELAAIYCEMGTMHYQLGKFYPYERAIAPENMSLLREFKKILDPKGILNPGALGL